MMRIPGNVLIKSLKNTFLIKLFLFQFVNQFHSRPKAGFPKFVANQYFSRYFGEK